MRKINQIVISITVTVLILAAIYPSLGCDCCDECCDSEEKEEDYNSAQLPQYIGPIATVIQQTWQQIKPKKGDDKKVADSQQQPEQTAQPSEPASQEPNQQPQQPPQSQQPAATPTQGPCLEGPGTFIHANLIQTDLGNNESSYEVSFLVTACKQDITYSVYLADPEKKGVAEGKLSVNEQDMDTVSSKGSIKYGQACIETNDPEKAKECWSPTDR